MQFKRFTVTSALPYANGPVHIGHLAGVYVPADIYVRYLRLLGKDVVYIGGSDEHGVPITIKARKEGVPPREIVDRYHSMIKQSFEEFGISFDIYSRTSSDIHHNTAAEIFRTIFDKGVFDERSSMQLYDEAADQFLADRYVTGTCPHCSFEKAYGDQCENCGTSLSPLELINPRSALSGNVPVMKETTHWYLPLDKDEEWLREWILEGHKDDWKVNVYGQCKSWIDQGLRPRAVTRDLDWGVKVPIEGAEGKVLYVWFDAPIGYISATKEWAAALGKNWEPYWKSNDTKLVHFIGKDNIVFHCIIFPSILKAEGSYILPDNVPANEFMNLESEKISTSRNWAVWLHEYLLDFPGKQDVLRYALTANAPETKDNDFTWKDFQARNNNELVAIFGNFVNRTMVLTQKFYEGIVPEKGNAEGEYADIIRQISEFPALIASSLERYRFREAQGIFMDLARLGNKFLTDQEPWKLIRTDPQKVKEIIHLSIQICANLAIAGEPFLPFTSQKIRTMLGMGEITWEMAGNCALIPDGRQLGEAHLLFAKIEDDMIEHQVQKLRMTKEENTEAQLSSSVLPAQPSIEFNQFAAIDIRIATILEAEKVAKTKKLLKLKVDTGIDQRVVVSGIAEYYNPEEIIGKQVLLLVNLEPRDIKGIASQGMILMAENAAGELSFVESEKAFAAGSRVK
ncbi:MAG: methionine--tRNA ligase [Bacteroidetes bacterium]|nr:methionine--tRNA ligase [Bacteroidota bacterium]MBU1719418.1 methionine--tRNA ligase [Bacteroidota bacterium]